MEGEVIAPNGDDQRRARIGIRGEHAFVGNPHGVDKIRFDAFDKSAQAIGCAANRKGTEPLPDGGAQSNGPRGSGARALICSLQRAKCDGHDLQAIIASVKAMQEVEGQPSILIAHTVKGKGVSFIEKDYTMHGRSLSPAQDQQAREEIRCL